MAFSNILLIDDDDDDQEIFLAAMKDISNTFTCTVAFSAQIAFQQLLAGEMIPDIIFLDLNMPIMNGKQFLSELKKNEALNMIPVIILSTSAHSATIQETKELGARDFITKPASFKDFRNILQSILD
jgi:CheY-like chemotaxis protein